MILVAKINSEFLYWNGASIVNLIKQLNGYEITIIYDNNHINQDF